MGDKGIVGPRWMSLLAGGWMLSIVILAAGCGPRIPNKSGRAIAQTTLTVRPARSGPGSMPRLVPDRSPWCSTTTAAVYAGEEATVQGGIDIPAVSGVGVDAATEAFDQPLTKAEVLAIVAPFIDTKNG